MIGLRRRASLTVVFTALLGACSSESPSPRSPLAPSASTELQLSNAIGGATIQAANQWIGLASLPFPRSHTVSVAANGRLYTIGGTDGTAIFKDVTEYNPSSNTWTTKAPMPLKLDSQLGATLIGSLVYVPGGWDGNSYQSRLFIYNPVANSWSSGPSMPIPGACGGSVEIGNILYVAIGCDFSGVTGKLLKFDPSTGTWTRLPNAPGTHGGGTVFDVNGKVYWDASTTSSGVDVYDPATNGWTSGPPHVTRRFSHVSGAINGAPLSAGGYTTTSALNTTEYMDEKGNRWAPRANMFAMTYTASAAVLNGEWYVVGGLLATKTISTVQKYTPGDYWLTASSMPTPRGNLAVASIGTAVSAMGGRLPNSTTPLATHEAYNPLTGNWITLAPLPSARWGAAAAAIGGTVYLIGGFTGDSGTTATSTVYAYSPVSNSWATKASAPTPMGFVSAAVVQGAIYVSLGTDGSTFSGKKVYRYNPVADSWSILPNAPGVHGQGVAAGIGAYFIAVGGAGTGGVGRDLDGFNVSSNSWSSGAQTPSALVGASGGAIGTNVYIAFGNNFGTYTNATSVFDGITRLWSTRTVAPEALAFTASTDLNGELITVGGFRQNGTATGTARRYVP